MSASAARRFADNPLYAPLAPWLAQLPDAAPPPLELLDRWRSENPASPLNGSGRPLRFVADAAPGAGYERHIHDTGCVPTRPDNWHDAFNALVWLRFPRAKAALNARHLREFHGDGVRGAARDAATLFDESGVVVACSDVSLGDALRAHRWREVFVERRAELATRLRFVVFGHACYDQLRAPYFGLCAKALIVPCTEASLAAADLIERLDAALAARLADPARFATPLDLSPLPLLGIPGVTPENENPAYYDDVRQFRPARRAQSDVPLAT